MLCWAPLALGILVAAAPEDAVALAVEESGSLVLLAPPVASSDPPALVLGGKAVLACEDYRNLVSCWGKSTHTLQQGKFLEEDLP
jgi:hypothetical protein